MESANYIPKYEFRVPGSGFRPGSILVIVVGLLTMIAMLGTTFLLVSRLDRRTAEGMAKNTAAEPIAKSMVQQIQNTLKTDLHIDDANSGPYHEIPTTAPGWRQYVDYPSDEIDPHLASNDTDGIDTVNNQCTYAHISNLAERFDTADVTNPMFAIAVTDGPWRIYRSTGASTWNSTPEADLYGADTDNDTWPDAILFDTGVTNSAGEEYYAAVKIIDLSGLICVNTAGNTSLTSPISPVNVGLEEYLSTFTDGADRYTRLHDERADGAALQDFEDSAVCRLFYPAATTYVPFSIGDEFHLRDYGTTGIGNIGRVFLAINSTGTSTGTALDADGRRYLTSFNCSRLRVRHPEYTTGSVDFRTIEYMDTSDASTTPIDANRQNFYDRVLAYLEKLQIGSSAAEQKRMAAHFVANYWAQNTGTTMADTSHWAFQPDGESFIVYGIRQQELVITEMYAKCDDDNDGGGPLTNDSYWGYAIEIYNPTSSAITLTNNYKLETPAGSVSLSGTLGSESHLVLYNWSDENDLLLADILSKLGFPNSLTLASRTTNLDFSTINTTDRVLLIRKITNSSGSTVDIPVDRVEITTTGSASNTSFDYISTGENEMDIQRDDTARYNVGVHLTTKTPTLGNPNSFTTAELTDLESFGAGYPVEISDAETIVSLSDLSKVFFTGPYYDSTVATVEQYKALPGSLTTTIFADVFPDGPNRGRLDFHPNYYGTGSGVTATEIQSGGWNSSAYPDVPAASLVGEFLSNLAPDDQRTDEDEDTTNSIPAQYSRIYGKININTATPEVLQYLPFPEYIDTNQNDSKGSGEPDVVPLTAANYIVAYRDQKQFTTTNITRDYTTRSSATAAGLSSLRSDTTDSALNGYFSFAEVAIPLADYANTLNSITSYASVPTLAQEANYVKWRDSIFKNIANLVTVNSDTYAAYIYIKIPDDPDEPGGDAKYEARYLTVIDRSNCRTAEDQPAVLLFTPIK